MLVVAACSARETIQQAFGPAVKVVSVPAREIVLGEVTTLCHDLLTALSLALLADAGWAQNMAMNGVLPSHFSELWRAQGLSLEGRE